MLTVGWDWGVDPTGLARAGDCRKWGGNEAACIAVNAAVGWGIDRGCCKSATKIQLFSLTRWVIEST